MRKHILKAAAVVMALCTLLVAAAAISVLGERLNAPKALPAAEPSGAAPPVYELLRRGGAERGQRQPQRRRAGAQPHQRPRRHRVRKPRNACYHIPAI